MFTQLSKSGISFAALVAAFAFAYPINASANSTFSGLPYDLSDFDFTSGSSTGEVQQEQEDAKATEKKKKKKKRKKRRGSFR